MAQRLSKKDIDSIFKQERTVRGSFFFIKGRQNTDGMTRRAIIISKNIAKHAVDRTTMRRRLRHAIVDAVGKNASLDLVFILTGSIVRKGYGEIKSEIEESIKKFFV